MGVRSPLLVIQGRANISVPASAVAKRPSTKSWAWRRALARAPGPAGGGARIARRQRDPASMFVPAMSRSTIREGADGFVEPGDEHHVSRFEDGVRERPWQEQIAALNQNDAEVRPHR